ncbi:hypothetical protein [Asanoa iriomotensis]|uniref:hypothetical protein n=1 Tax=Asanoa iriomotensis TaxID=234613 RepID=UPI0019426A26|nr:hypothetical protein [Asanoa iriomotensis]
MADLDGLTGHAALARARSRATRVHGCCAARGDARYRVGDLDAFLVGLLLADDPSAAMP